LRDSGEIRVSLPEKLDKLVQSSVDGGLFRSKAELAKIAIIEYLDKMHLLDQIKTNIESKPG
jgi:Arc/MetJ-type ribon-helix-helix transcriptional regulator